MLHLRELRVFAMLCCLERQRGCGKIGLLLRPLFLPLDGTCPRNMQWHATLHLVVGSYTNLMGMTSYQPSHGKVV